MQRTTTVSNITLACALASACSGGGDAGRITIDSAGAGASVGSSGGPQDEGRATMGPAAQTGASTEAGNDDDGVATVGSSGEDGTTSDEGGSTGEPLPGFCGDTVRDAGEACDDGNLLNGDGCNIDCRLSGQQISLRRFPFDGRVDLDANVQGIRAAARSDEQLWLTAAHNESVWTFDIDAASLVLSLTVENRIIDTLATLEDGGMLLGGSVRENPLTARRDKWLGRLDTPLGTTFERIYDGAPRDREGITAMALRDDGVMFLAGMQQLDTAGGTVDGWWVGRLNNLEEATDFSWESTRYVGYARDIAVEGSALTVVGEYGDDAVIHRLNAEGITESFILDTSGVRAVASSVAMRDGVTIVAGATWEEEDGEPTGFVRATMGATPLWDLTWPGGWPRDVEVMPDGNLVVVGNMPDAEGAGSDVRVQKLTLAGDTQWDQTTNGTANETAFAALAFGHADLFVVGLTSEFLSRTVFVMQFTQ